MDEKKVSFQFDARYYTAGTLNESTRQIWIVFHGYGQLAQYFLRKFEHLTNQDIYLIAPEGLSRFYLSELTNSGRPDNKVGATWMTRENRLMDIDNAIRYLDAMLLHEQLNHSRIPVTLFGFSQGCATVCRWAIEGKAKFERLILWAGLFPPDMNFEKGHDLLASKTVTMVIGEQDQFLTKERMDEFDMLAGKLGIQPEKLLFNGKHELNAEVLEKLAR